jgi:hypothetical protein
VLHPDAESELVALPSAEAVAMQHGIEKLRAFGDRLGYPHSSQVKGASALRELRPRAGRSPWRGFYRRRGDMLVLAAIGPEANADRQGFRGAVQAAEDRLAALEREDQQ